MNQLTSSSSPEEIAKFLEDEEETNLSLADIYNQLQVHGELIITIPADEEGILRKGLAGVKAKQNMKLKASNLPIDTATLSYTVLPKKDAAGKEVPGQVDVQILLSKRTQITVLGIKKPDMEI